MYLNWRIPRGKSSVDESVSRRTGEKRAELNGSIFIYSLSLEIDEDDRRLLGILWRVELLQENPPLYFYSTL
jgi:hypothetical protein